MKKGIKLLLLGACVLPLTSCFGLQDGENNNEETRVITDMLNRKVTIKKDPSKFVCMGPGCLRQYSYVSDVNELVGIEHCEQKESGLATKPYLNKIKNFMTLPVIGEGGPKDQSNKEALLNVNPDVIFTSYVSDTKSLDDLSKQTGIPVVAVGYDSNGLFKDIIYDSLELIGDITGHKERADAVVKYFKDSKADLERRVKPKLEDPNFVKKRGYFGATNHRGSFGIESTTGDFPIFDTLGIKNVVNEVGINSFAMLDKEKLPDLNPDIIIVDAGGLEYVKADMKEKPEYYREINAFKNHEVYLEMPFVFYSNNFDVSLANTYFVGKTFYPEEFKDIDVAKKFDDIMTFLLDVKVYDKMTSYFNATYGKFDYTL